MADNNSNQKSFTQQPEMHSKNLRGPQVLNEHADFITSQTAESKGIKAGKGKQIIVYDLPDLRFLPYEPDSTGFNASDTLVRFSVEIDDGSVDIKVNNMKFRMMPVPGGTFNMGCTRPGAAKHNYEAEFPVHKVTVDTFYMGKFEVTQAQWAAVMGNNPSGAPDSDYPVENVSWDDCQEFLKKTEG